MATLRQRLTFVHFSAERKHLSGTRWVVSVTKTAQAKLRGDRMEAPALRSLKMHHCPSVFTCAT